LLAGERRAVTGGEEEGDGLVDEVFKFCNCDGKPRTRRAGRGEPDGGEVRNPVGGNVSLKGVADVSVLPLPSFFLCWNFRLLKRDQEGNWIGRPLERIIFDRYFL
jgi:hypothetical protein